MIDFGTLQDIYTVGKKIYDTVQSIKNAPKLILALQRQVAVVHGVLRALGSELEGRKDAELDDWSVEAFLAMSDEALELMKEVEGFLDKATDKKRSSRIIRAATWIVSGESEAKDLAERFHKFHVSLNDVHGAVQLRLSRDSQNDLERMNANLQMMTEYQAASFQISWQSQRGIEEILRKVKALYEHSSGEDRRIQEPGGSSSGLSLKSSSASANRGDRGTQGNTADHAAVSCTTGFSGPPGHYFGYCGPNCKCRCHHTTISIIPLVLDSLLGRSHPRVQCNESACKHLQRMTFSVLRSFRQITAEVWIEGQTLTHVSLRLPRIVGRRDFAWLELATLDEVRQKLSNRELTVNDVHPNGMPVLHIVTVRLILDRSDTTLAIVALLTEHSAPTDWEYGGLTPTEQALWWSLVYWRRYESPKASLNALKHRLGPYLPQDIDDAYEGLATKMHWTELHNYLCQLSSSALTPVSSHLVPQANIQDFWGWTPLFYAMLVCPEAFYALLCAGANPRTRIDILHWAVKAGADTAISTLVRAGAYINVSDPEHLTALHWAVVVNINGLAIALELVRHVGHLLNWEMRDDDGDTPLDWAQLRVDKHPDDEDSKRILDLYRTRRLPDGAQHLPTPSIVNAEDESAHDEISGLPSTSLVRAGLRGDIEAIGDLIHRGAMVNERDGDGRTLLHLVALGAVPDGYRVALELVRHGGWGVDWNAFMMMPYVIVDNHMEYKQHETRGANEDDRETRQAMKEKATVHDSPDEDENGLNNDTADRRERTKVDICDGDDTCEHETGRERESESDRPSTGNALWTPLAITSSRLCYHELNKQEREELEKVRDLLEAQRLPPGEEYLWPCMDPDFYNRMPGAWD